MDHTDWELVTIQGIGGYPTLYLLLIRLAQGKCCWYSIHISFSLSEYAVSVILIPEIS